MVQRPSWEANWFAASQIPRILRNLKVHYRAHKRRPPVSILGQPNPIQSIYPHPTSWRPILILSIHLCLGLPSGLLPSGFPTKTLYAHLSSPIRVTCPAHLILLDFIIRTILGEEYKSFSSSLCNLLHSPVTSSLLGSNILLNTMFSNTISFLSSRMMDTYSCPKHVENRNEHAWKTNVRQVGYLQRLWRYARWTKSNKPKIHLLALHPFYANIFYFLRRKGFDCPVIKFSYT